MAVPTNLLTPEMIESNKAHNGDLRNRVVEASARQKIILETINERMKQTDNTAKKLKELLEQKAKTQKKFAEALAKQKPPKVGENMKTSKELLSNVIAIFDAESAYHETAAKAIDNELVEKVKEVEKDADKLRKKISKATKKVESGYDSHLKSCDSALTSMAVPGKNAPVDPALGLWEYHKSVDVVYKHAEDINDTVKEVLENAEAIDKKRDTVFKNVIEGLVSIHERGHSDWMASLLNRRETAQRTTNPDWDGFVEAGGEDKKPLKDLPVVVPSQDFLDSTASVILWKGNTKVKGKLSSKSRYAIITSSNFMHLFKDEGDSKPDESLNLSEWKLEGDEPQKLVMKLKNGSHKTSLAFDEQATLQGALDIIKAN